MACILANILVATRLTYSMARDNMLPFSHVWRHVSPTRKTPTYSIIGLGCLSTLLLLSAIVNEKAFNYIIGIASLLFFFVYILQTVGLLVGYRKGTIPTGDPGTFDLGRFRLPIYITALVVFLSVAVTLLFLPQFTNNKWVFLGVVAIAAVWWATGLKARLSRGDAGVAYAKSHNV